MAGNGNRARKQGEAEARRPRGQAKAKAAPKAPRTQQVPESGGYAPEFTEDGLALTFAQRHRDRFRWMEEWHCWMEWTGTQWRRVKTLAVYDLIRKLCREAAERVDTSTAGGEKLAADLNTAKKRAAVQTIARSDMCFEAVSEQWDADGWLLGTPGGIIDLRTGQNIGFDATKYITLTTTVAPGGECPTWLAFLVQVTQGDADLQAYLQRMCGYSLTGCTREHSLTFIYGPGGNGKGTFLGAITGIMGELHKAADVDTFAERKHQEHSTELARLHNARLVTSQETEAGQFWAEARLKKLTGGDPITARFMRCDDFEFTPKFKLVIVGNHKPKFRSVDEAIRRRLHLIPFDYKVVKADRDVNLAGKLKAEWPGILAWMIEGCLEWQKRGLDAPECVLKATDDYLDGEDTIGQWIGNRCKLEQYGRANLKDLFESWKYFCELTGVRNVGTSRDLAAELEKRLGEGSKRTVKGIARFIGITLKTADEMRCDADFESGEVGEVGQGRDTSLIEVSRTCAQAHKTLIRGDALPCPTHALLDAEGNSDFDRYDVDNPQVNGKAVSLHDVLNGGAK